MALYHSTPHIGRALSLVGVLAFLALLGLIIYGWVLNLLALLAHDGGVTGLAIARAIGLVIAPLGAVLGLFA